MTKYSPVFNAQEYELRNYTDPYLSPSQQEKVTQTESRVEGQLDFLAQSLGWNGTNYWSSLVSTASQKRQVLGGTFGVYNSFIIPRVYEIRNWNNTILIDRLQFLEPGRQTYVERIILGEDTYKLQSVKEEGDKYVISLGTLPQSFYDQIAANVPLKVDIPTYRPAPFRRNTVGVSGDNSFVCSASNGSLTLYPGWDTEKKFPYLFPIIFAGSTYYFDQPIYLTTPAAGSSDVLPTYDPVLEKWYLNIPQNLTNSQAGIEGDLVWSYSDLSSPVSVSIQVKIQAWLDPSDWGNLNVIENFRGAWNNKGGDLPFNLLFDSLSIHGFDEKKSLYLDTVSRTLEFNDIVNRVYSQRIAFGEIPPGEPVEGNLWWNPGLGELCCWVGDDICTGEWVEINYPQYPTESVESLNFANIADFSSAESSLPVGTIVCIYNISGLSAPQKVVGVNGTLISPGSMVAWKDSSGYWVPSSFSYANTSDFDVDANKLPFKVPVSVTNADALDPNPGTYKIPNLYKTISGEYPVVLTKYYNNGTWLLSASSALQFIANSSLYSTLGYLDGEMWWDYANPYPQSRAVAMYYKGSWVALNANPPTSVISPVLDMSTMLFYADGVLLTNGQIYATDNFVISYTSDAANGRYHFTYTPRNFLGKVILPVITVSDVLTTAYVSDITELIFGGIEYKMSPNVYDAETTLRLWKSQDLQDAETVSHLKENNYVNPLLADLNNGPGLENWERYFVRLPLDYGRNEEEWQKTVLICQDFGYWGSPVDPEKMRCPPEDDLPAIYEELFLYDQEIPDYTYVYCEPYLYSNIAYADNTEVGDMRNSGIFPATDVQYDEFEEASLVSYEPLHSRQAKTNLPVGNGYGDWEGTYVNINPCVALTGFFTTDLESGGMSPVQAPVWDASILKFPPTCENNPESYTVDANHYKVGYAYFIADASAAEEGFFDPQREASWRFPVTQPRTLYSTPR